MRRKGFTLIEVLIAVTGGRDVHGGGQMILSLRALWVACIDIRWTCGESNDYSKNDLLRDAATAARRETRQPHAGLTHIPNGKIAA